MSKRVSRRGFIAGAAVGMAAPFVVPSSALGLDGSVAPSNRIGLGVIGCGGKGAGGMRNFLRLPDVEVVALCDVSKAARDWAAGFAKLPEERRYNDFRELLAREDVDAVLVATPDHWHVLASLAAVRAGKDVYCEKPLSNTVAEGRALVGAVEQHGAIFQHGTQLRSLRATRQACELVRNGRIGELQRITIGSPPGLATGVHPAMPVPAGFDYDLWLGPAPEAPYTAHRIRIPGGLPGWYFISDYSKSGWVAGYGVHDIDLAHWGMGTEYTGPVEVEGEGQFPEAGLFDTVLTYRLEFKYANGVTLTMTDTGQNRHGVQFHGSEGWIFTRSEIETRPESLVREVIGPNETRLYESEMHERNFIDCVKSRAETITPVEVAHRATSVGLIGGIALKLGRKLRWDPEKERFREDEEANRLLSYAMRGPWRV